MTNCGENGDLASMCERLIQVSFSKIVSSKSERGGAKLRKNLLILHLLQRARTEQKSKFSALAKSLSEVEQFNSQDNSCNESNSTFAGQYDHLVAQRNPMNDYSSENYDESSSSSSHDGEMCQSELNSGLNLTCIRSNAFQNNPTPLVCEVDKWSSDYSTSTEQSSSSSHLLMMDVKPYSNNDHSNFESSRSFDDDDDDNDSFISVDDTDDFDINSDGEKLDGGLVGRSLDSSTFDVSYSDSPDFHISFNHQSNDSDNVSSCGNASSLAIEWFDDRRPKNMRRKRKLSPIAPGQISFNAPFYKRSCSDSADDSILSSSEFSSCDGSYKSLEVGQSTCELQGLISVFKTGMTGVGATTTKSSTISPSQPVTKISESIGIVNGDDDRDIQQRNIMLAANNQKTSLTEQQAALELTCAS